MLRKLRKNYRRLVAFMLTVAMTFTNVGTNLNVAFAAGEEQEALFLVDGEDLREAIDSAVDGGETFKFSSLELKAKSKSLKTSYEKLIGGKNGKVYQLDVDVDERYAPEDTSIEVFYNAGTEEVIFLFINESDMVVKFRANVDGYETARVTINPNAANVDDTEASYVEDYSNTTMIDDMAHTLGAEVLNPTTEAGADEGTDAEETSEAVEGPSGETDAADGSEAEESSPAEETGEAGEPVEGETTDAAETGSSETGETTEAAGSEAGETSGATGSEEETTEADENNTTEEAGETTEETTVEETGAEESEPETEAETETEIEAEAADNEADAEDEAAGEAGAADEAQPEAGSATASISIRKIRQVASSVQVLDDADIVIDPEDVPEDETPEISEDAEVEVEDEEKTEAPEEEPEETTETETEDTRAAETEETVADDAEEETSAADTEETAGDAVETSAADAEETTEADTENSGNDESSAADDETDAADESSGADIIIEETTAAGETDGTDVTDTPVEVETPAGTTPAEGSSTDKTEAPEGSGADQSGSVVEEEGQELEDDINGILENLGTLDGKAYNTVTIWGSANARAYKVALKDLAGIETVTGTFRVDYTSDPVGVAEIKGSRSISEGENLYFAVIPQVGFELTGVTANGVELEAVDAATVEADAADLAQYEYVYVAEEVAEDLEVVASLEEVKEGSHPEFSDSVTVNGVTVTATAEEGIIPEGTVLDVKDVTSQVEDAIKEKLENENSDKSVQAVLAYDINLMLNGKKLNNTWGDGADSYVSVKFSGSRIASLSKEADQVEVSTLKTPTREVAAALGGTEEMAVVEDISADNIEVNSEELNSIDVSGDASVRTVGFDATHFTVSYAAFMVAEETVKTVESIEIILDDTDIEVGKTATASVKILPEDSQESVIWGSSDTNVATVTAEGVITGVGTGNATITAAAGKATATIKIAVVRATEGDILQEAVFFVLKPNGNPDGVPDDNWYNFDWGQIEAPDIENLDNGTTFDTRVIKTTPPDYVGGEGSRDGNGRSSYPSITYANSPYRYAEPDKQKEGETYYIVWDKVSVSDGANAGAGSNTNGFVQNGVKIWHVDGTAYIYSTDKCTVAFKIKDVGQSAFFNAIDPYLVTKETNESELKKPQLNAGKWPETKIHNGVTYRLTSWCLDEDCTQEAKFDGTVTENKFYYAAYVPDFSITAQGYSGTYDGQPHGPLAVNAPASATVEYLVDNKWVTEVPAIEDVGKTEYRVRATISGVSKETTFKLEVTRRPLNITGDNVTLPYTGQEQTVDTGYTTGKIGEGESAADQLLAGHAIRTKDGGEISATATGTNAGGPYNGTITSKDDVRIYDGSVDVTSNYEITTIPGTLTITKLPELVVNVTGNHEEKPYTGQKQTVSGFKTSELPAGVTVTLKTGSKAIAEGTNVLPVNGTSDGTYKMGLKSEDFVVNAPNYEKVTVNILQDGYLKITPVKITVTATDTGKLFGTKDPEKFEYTATGAVNGETPAFVGKLVRIEGEDVDTYSIVNETEGENRADILQLVDGEGFLAQNYTMEYVPGTFTISTNQNGLELVVTNYDKSYDGEMHSATAVVKKKDTNETVAGATVEYSVDTENWTPETATWTAAAPVFKDVKIVDGKSAAYTVHIRGNAEGYGQVTGSGTVLITPKKVTIQSASLTKTYDSAPLSNDSIGKDGVDVVSKNTTEDNNWVAENGWVGQEGIVEYSFAGSQTDVGTGKNIISYSGVKENLKPGTELTNYDIQLIHGTLEVVEAETLVIYIKGTVNERIYTGDPITINGTGAYTAWMDADHTRPLPTGVTVNVKEAYEEDVKVSGINAGTYPLTLNAEWFEGSSKNHKQVTFIVTNGSLTITKNSTDPVTVKISGNTDTKVYNGASQSVEGFTYEVSGANKDDVTVTWKPDQENHIPKAVGTDVSEEPYKVPLLSEDFTAVHPNYSNIIIEIVDGKGDVALKITPALLNLYAADASKPYDGAELTAPYLKKDNSGEVKDTGVIGLMGTDDLDWNVLKIEGSQTRINEPEDKDNNNVIGSTVKVIRITTDDGGEPRTQDVTGNYTITLHPGTLTVTRPEDLPYIINRIFLDEKGQVVTLAGVEGEFRGTGAYEARILNPQVESQSDLFDVDGTTLKGSITEESKTYVLLTNAADYEMDLEKKIALVPEEGTNPNVVNIYYALDAMGATDPDDPDKKPEQPDGIPDMFQVILSYQVVNGGWNEGSNGASSVLTLGDASGKYDVNGSAVFIRPAAGENPQTPGYAKNGAWDKEQKPESVGKEETFQKAGNEEYLKAGIGEGTDQVPEYTYTYTYTAASYNLTVQHVFRKGRAGKEEIVRSEYAKATDGSDMNQKATVYLTELGYPVITDSESLKGFVFDKVQIQIPEGTEKSLTWVSDDQKVAGTMPAAEVTITFIYEADEIGTKPEQPDTPDQIPDKYQISFEYLAKLNGTVTASPQKEVHNLYELTSDTENGGWKAADTLNVVKPAANELTVTADKGYAFDYWTREEYDPTSGTFVDTEEKDYKQTLDGFKRSGATEPGYTENQKFWANFDVDVIGGTDPENPGDDIPDKYQILITHQVVNGGWNGVGESNSLEQKERTKLLTLMKDGHYDNSDQAIAVYDNSPQAGANPATGYKAGNWYTVAADGSETLMNAVPKIVFGNKDGGTIYRYCYQKDAFDLTVKHVYRKTDGTPDHTVYAQNTSGTDSTPRKVEFEASLNPGYGVKGETGYVFADLEIKVAGQADTSWRTGTGNWTVTGGTVTGTMPSGTVEITFYYDTDVIGGTDPENPGDGKPDRYQRTFIYEVGDGRGKVRGVTKEVVTIRAITSDPMTGGLAVGTTDIPASPTRTEEVIVDANRGFRFAMWKDGTSDNAVEYKYSGIDPQVTEAQKRTAADTALMNAEFTTDQTFYAYFENDPTDLARVYYKAAPEGWGTVENGETEGHPFQIVDAAGLVSSEATELPGYKFTGWYKEGGQGQADTLVQGADDPKLSTDKAKQFLNYETDQKLYTDTTFIAKFAYNDDTVNVSYISGNPLGGYVELLDGDEGNRIDAIQVASGNTVKGATAKAYPGYSFKRWEKLEAGTSTSATTVELTEEEKDEGFSEEKLKAGILEPEVAKNRLNKNTEEGKTHLYAATTYRAVFEENGDVQITYVSADSGMGKVQVNASAAVGAAGKERDQEMVAPATGRAKGATAYAEPGYHFVEWALIAKKDASVPEGGTKVSDEGSDTKQGTLSAEIVHNQARIALETEKKIYVPATFEARFAEDSEVTIHYTVNNDTMGELDLIDEHVGPATGRPSGSTATAYDGYELTGWSWQITSENGVVAEGEVTDPQEFNKATGRLTPQKRDGVYVNITYTANFAPVKTLSYNLHYMYEATPGAYTENKELSELESVKGNAVFGQNIPYSKGHTVFGEQTYVFERIAGEKTVNKEDGIPYVTETKGPNDLYVYYTLDVIGETGPDEPDKVPDRPDGIPDKYQIRFDYESAGNGSLVVADDRLVQKSSEVQTIYKLEDILGLNDPETGVTIRDGAQKLNAVPHVPGIQAADNYAFDYWTNVQSGTRDFTKEMETLVKPYTSSQKFIVRFDTDKLRQPDPEKPDDPKGPDGIPDKYQTVVTFEVINGSWNDRNLATKFVEVLKLTEDGTPDGIPAENGKAVYTAPGAGAAPAAGYEAPANVQTGWNTVPPVEFTSGEHTYTYTYQISSFNLTVNHVYRFTDESGKETETTYPDRGAATRKYGEALNCQPTGTESRPHYASGNYVYAGVQATGLADGSIKNGSITGNMPANDVTVTFYYEADNKGTTDPETPDGIPDKYQITFTYKIGGSGHFVGTDKYPVIEVATLYESFTTNNNGEIMPVGDPGVSPKNPPVAQGNAGYYFRKWNDGAQDLESNDRLKGESYQTDTTFTAYFEEDPDNGWSASKEITNIPARGYFRVGEDAIFEIKVWMKEGANRPVKDITVKELREGAYFETYAGCGYTVDASNPGVAKIARLEPAQNADNPVILRAVYKVTRNDLFNRSFRNTVRVEGINDPDAITPNEPGDKRQDVKPLEPGSGDVPAGAQGGGSGGSGGGGGGSSTRSPGTGGGAAGGPGVPTTTIDPEAVPLANLPDMGNDDILALIDDEEVPLAALPKTGQTGSAALMLMLSSMMLAAFAVVTRKKEEEQ